MKKDKNPEKTVIALSLAGMFLGAVILGAFIMYSGIPPANSLREAFEGGSALMEKISTNRGSELKVNMWRNLKYKEAGVVNYDPSIALNGYTLVTSGHFSGAWLLDMRGNIAHEWKAPFHQVWPNPPHVQSAMKEELIYWRRAWLYPNGNVLAIYVANGDTPWGYGAVMVDKDSKVLWNYPHRTHHDIWVDKEGKIYLLVHTMERTPPPDMPFLPTPYLSDYVVVLSPEGKELKRISILEAFRRSDFMNVIYTVRYRTHYSGDFLHTNTVKYIDDAPENLPFVKKGQILFSMRSLSVIGLIDVESEKVVWLHQGSWLHQHDPMITGKGTIALLDNDGDLLRTGASRVMEYDPLTMEIVWQWSGTKKRPMYTELRGTNQILPNGNILITSSDEGRMIEVTRDKHVAWEFLNPERKAENGIMKTAVLSGGKRFIREQLPFLDEINAPQQDYGQPVIEEGSAPFIP